MVTMARVAGAGRRMVAASMTIASCLLAAPGAAQPCAQSEGTADNPCHHDEDLQVIDTKSMSGSHVYPSVTIAGTINVDSYDGADLRRGWLHLRSKEITIEATAVIDADGAGWPHGQMDAPSEGVTAMGLDPYMPEPGGGGSHLGLGGRGRHSNDQPTNICATAFPGDLCDIFAGANGGSIYDDPRVPLALSSDPRMGMGSAGGGSQAGCPNDDQSQNGYPGGGAVVLIAETVHIDGRISTNGSDAPNTGAAGPGAGAGGSIVIRALNLSSGSNARLSAAGGLGIHHVGAVGNSLGGGGGGGLIVIQAPEMGAVLSNADVSGGTIDACADQSTDQISGEPGVATMGATPSCIDADLDGFEVCADPSQTQDCHDGRETVSPDACERCIGSIDEDCDGDPDNAPANGCAPLCPIGSGSTCVDGACQAGGSDSTAAGANDPPAVELRGGLCSSGPAVAGDEHSYGSLLWLGLAGGFALWLRRRHPCVGVDGAEHRD